METCYKYNKENDTWKEFERTIVSDLENETGRQHTWSNDTIDIQTGMYQTITRIVEDYNKDGNLVAHSDQVYVGKELGENGTVFRTIFGYTLEYDEQGNAIKVQASSKGEKDAILLPYNNSADQWDCPDFISWSAEANYVDQREHISPVAINFSTPETSLRVNESIQIVAEVLPVEASNKEIHWISTNESIATVSVDGEVTGVAEGITTVRACTLDGRIEGEMKVIVQSAASIEQLENTYSVTCDNGLMTVKGEGIQMVSVYDLNGQKQCEANGSCVFLTGKWHQGVYLVQVQQYGYIRTHKVVVGQ